MKTFLKIIAFLVGVSFLGAVNLSAFAGPPQSPPKCEKCYRDPADGKVKCKPVPCP